VDDIDWTKTTFNFSSRTQPWWVTHTCATNFCDIELEPCTDDTCTEVEDNGRAYCMPIQEQDISRIREDMKQDYGTGGD